MTNEQFIKHAKSMDGAEYTMQGILSYLDETGQIRFHSRDWFNVTFRKDFQDYLNDSYHYFINSIIT